MTRARASASAAYRWWECSASIDEAAKYPQSESKYAAEGTAAHKLAAAILLGGDLGRAASEPRDPAVWAYVDYICSSGVDGDYEVEVDLTPFLQKIHPDLGGTADCGIDSGKDWIEIVDYKHGAGMFVPAEDNLQLRIYALGYLLKVNRPGIKRVRATIVQPRIEHADPIRTWEFDAVELLEFAADVAAAAQRTRNSSKFQPGDWCKFCPAAGGCKALKEVSEKTLLAEFTPIMDVAVLARGLDMIPALEARIKAMRELAYNLAIQGIKVPGHKLVAKRATRKWNPDFQLDYEWYEQKPMSPAQVEQRFGRNAIPEGAVIKESSGMTLVPDSDNRPETTGTASLEDFSVSDGTAEIISNPPSNFTLD